MMRPFAIAVVGCGLSLAPATAGPATDHKSGDIVMEHRSLDTSGTELVPLRPGHARCARIPCRSQRPDHRRGVRTVAEADQAHISSSI